MRWSKIKKQLEEKLAENLQGRLQYHITVYTKDYSASKTANRAWITFDKKEIINFSSEDFFWYNKYYYNNTTPTDLAKSDLTFSERTEGKIIESGEFSMYDFTECAYHFLNMNVNEALAHESPIIKMLAIVDKRTGKRTLEKLKNNNQHPLVQTFINLRLEKEFNLNEKKC